MTAPSMVAGLPDSFPSSHLWFVYSTASAEPCSQLLWADVARAWWIAARGALPASSELLKLV
jgi:hypothetical protein